MKLESKVAALELDIAAHRLMARTRASPPTPPSPPAPINNRNNNRKPLRLTPRARASYNDSRTVACARPWTRQHLNNKLDNSNITNITTAASSTTVDDTATTSDDNNSNNDERRRRGDRRGVRGRPLDRFSVSLGGGGCKLCLVAERAAEVHQNQHCVLATCMHSSLFSLSFSLV